MSTLHDILEKQIPALRDERRDLLKQHSDKTVGDVNVKQVVGGMRGITAMVCDTSVVDPDKGLLIRGTPVSNLADRLPEEVFFMLLTGRLPDANELGALRADLGQRARVPDHVWRVVEAMHKNSHPMAMLSAAVLSMTTESVFSREYERGLTRDDYWRTALEDCLNLIATVPTIAAGIYRLAYDKGPRIDPNPELDWAGDFAHMIGIDATGFAEYLRLATIVQSDHEGAHASALSCHIVGSVLSDIYYAVPAGWNALAGPLHGLASQVCLHWILDAIEEYNGVPSEDQIREYSRQTIAAGHVIPGYGHAVLRGQDPRYLAILAFGEKNTQRDDIFKTVVRASRVVPSVLMEQGKVKNPWPNVDAINGALFHHFGISEIPFYTVFFATALTFGFCAQYVLNRALATPIVRPRSVTTSWLQNQTKP